MSANKQEQPHQMPETEKQSLSCSPYNHNGAQLSFKKMDTAHSNG